MEGTARTKKSCIWWDVSIFCQHDSIFVSQQSTLKVHTTWLWTRFHGTPYHFSRNCSPQPTNGPLRFRESSWICYKQYIHPTRVNQDSVSWLKFTALAAGERQVKECVTCCASRESNSCSIQATAQGEVRVQVKCCTLTDPLRTGRGDQTSKIHLGII